MPTRIRQAVILAAGFGSRLAGAKDELKPLVRVAGLSLIKRNLLMLKHGGIEEAVIVLGHRGDEVENTLKDDPDLEGIDIRFVNNPDYDKQNGLSVLAAKPVADRRFFLLMADHVFDRGILNVVSSNAMPSKGALLCIDRKISSIYDMDDATKVQTTNNRLVEIGKELESFDAIDTGLFCCTHDLFDALDQSKVNGDCALSDGIRSLARRGSMRVLDIGEHFWQDVDTPGSKKHAENLLWNSCRKPIDGIIARSINRNVSLQISRRLVNTDITPNQISVVTFLLGIAAALSVAQGGYQWFLLGALLFKANSILDGVDGELARIKFKFSLVGEWFDTISDDLSNLFFYIGLTIGAFRATGNEFWVLVGSMTVLFFLGVSAFIYRWLIANKRGDLLAFQTFFDDDEAEDLGLGSKILRKVKYLVKKDFFVFLCAVLAIIGILPVALVLSALGSSIAFFALLYQHVAVQHAATQSHYHRPSHAAGTVRRK